MVSLGQYCFSTPLCSVLAEFTEEKERGKKKSPALGGAHQRGKRT
jgi:hypothetical protein